jgi:hypothetical protein
VFGNFEKVEIRKLSHMSFAENSFTVINEYGFSLFKSKFDPLAAIEAKTAMTKKTQVVLSLSLDRALVQSTCGQDDSVKTKEISTLIEEAEEEMSKNRAISLSPPKGSQEAP